ncbi:hypothetical protein [Geminocystis sp. NIES-3709]|uniref:hypothetical protein n=1 Tax=Geminocystis sp. NIES-3709 TaxID=1617448 RepID=UPI0005FC6D4A|nr:hypothetical protein [Geminocystis sp. NIES-3709]BAQ65488.1 hypothetical protein GM3709_2253 [Geminocystis sp. NIES-3709]
MVTLSGSLTDRELENNGLKIFFFSAYSLQLNLIEILWRFIDYEWLEIESNE